MPYIKQEDRKSLDEYLAQMPELHSLGELDYLITKILLKTKPKSFTDFSALIGVLESIKLEFYQRVVLGYEKKKMKQHGDVF